MSVRLHRRVALRRLALIITGLSLAVAVSCTRPTQPGTTTTTVPGTGAARGNPASYRTYQYGGIPRWNPCAPIHYVTNVSSAGYPGAVSDVQYAVGQISRDTGLSFQYDGEVGTRISQQWGNSQVNGAFPPVLIAWARRSQTDAYNGITTPGATLGATHAWFRRTATGAPVIVGGNVALEPDGLASSRVVPGTGVRSLGVTLMHELGHLVGLDHVNDTQQLMAPAIGVYSTYGAGDLAGLKVVGAGHGCLQTQALPSSDDVSITSVPADIEVISRVDAD